MKINIKKITAVFIAVIIFILSSISVFAVTVKKASTKTKIKIGYTDYKSFIERNKDGSYSGYAVDYLNEIAKYTDFEYEYVFDSWNNLLTKLKNKDIDFICSAQLSDERKAEYSFSNYPIGYTHGMLCTRKNNTDFYYNDFSTFNGKTIGALKNNVMISLFESYTQKNNFNYNLKIYQSEEEMLTDLNNKKINLIITESLSYHNNLKLVSDFGADAFYIMGYKNSPYMDNINYALMEIKRNQSFESNLYNKYYSTSSTDTDPHFTREEIEFIKSCPTLKVALNASIKPVTYIDSKTHALSGITPQILEKISQISGINFEYQPLLGTSEQYTYDYFITNSVDLIASIEVNEFNNNIESLTLSEPYFSAQKVLVGRQGETITRGEKLKIAIIGGSGTLPSLIKKSFPNFEIQTYETIEECLNAVKNKTADVLLYNNYLIEAYLAKPQYETLSVVHGMNLDESLALSPVIYKDNAQKSKVLNDQRLISILNKSIKSIPQDDISKIIVENTSAVTRTLSLGDFAYKYRLLLIIVAVLLLICILLIIIMGSIRHKAYIKISDKNKELANAVNIAEEANKAKSLFLARMSHEIRTPMNAIVGLTSIAKTKITDPTKTTEYLDKISDSSKILLNIINDVLDMSAIESEKLKIANTAFNLKEIITNISSIYYTQCKSKNIKFDCVTDVQNEQLIGDPLRVNQILLNLLSNAVKFTKDTVELKIEQKSKNDNNAYIRFSVSDNGQGVSDEMKMRIFKPFEQENADTAMKHGGSGLGLSITKNLIDLMHGAITLESEVEKGTSFIVDLPFGISDKDTSSTKETIKTVKTVKALIVDDDKDTREYTSAVLTRMGIEHEIASSGEEATDLLSNAYKNGTGYDICFIDWKMPGLSGIDVTRKIRELFDEDTLVIIVSAYDLTEIEDEAKVAGANMFITKPIFQSTVFDALNNITGGKYLNSCEDHTSFDFSGKRVLLAEDNEINREIANELLRMVNLEVYSAKNGKEALDMFEKSECNYYDMVLMDIQMPFMNGYEATQAIRKLDRKDAKTVPILAMTANAFTEDVSAALSNGMNGHIAKPIDTNILYKTIEQNIMKK